MVTWQAYEPGQADEIVLRARRGEISVEQAEVEAEVLGIGPLASCASLEKFDPMKEPYWSLGMTLAWIIWRTPERVQVNWNQWRNESWEWRSHSVGFVDGRTEKGYNLSQMEPRHVSDVFDRAQFLANYDDERHQQVETPENARNSLKRRLQDGQLLAIGIRNGDMLPSDIPAREWTTLSLDTSPLDGRPESIGAGNRFAPVFYRNVQIANAKILALWPACKAINVDLGATTQVKTLSDDDAKTLIRAEADKNNGFISLNAGEKILRATDPSMKRDSARVIVKSVIGNEKQGPRGPRNNSPGNRFRLTQRR